MARFSLLPKEEQYFALFTQMTSYIYDTARELVEMLNDKSGAYEAYVKRIKDIEHTCDELTHSIVTRLNKSFITPFDREDIYLLCSALDDIVDLIDAAARSMVMYHVNESTPQAREIARVIQNMAVELHEITKMMAKPVGMTTRLVEIHRLENEGDDIYHTAIGDLFHNTNDPMTVIKWKDIYENLEACVDRFEDVANVIESVMIKNA